MFRSRVLAAMLLLGASLSPDMSAFAATGPGAQQANVDTGVYVAPGDGLFVDAFGVVRFIINSNPVELEIPTYTAGEWASFRQFPPATSSQVVGCPPVAVSLCLVGGAAVQIMTLPTPAVPPGYATVFGNPNGYGVIGQSATATTICVDSKGIPYSDSVSATCSVAAGAGASAVGAWGAGSPVETCAPNSYTQTDTCSASCDGTQNVTVFDSCGNATGTYQQNCNTGSCCTPNATVGPCMAGSQTIYDSCGNPTGTQTCVAAPGTCGVAPGTCAGGTLSAAVMNVNGTGVFNGAGTWVRGFSNGYAYVNDPWPNIVGWTYSVTGGLQPGCNKGQVADGNCFADDQYQWQCTGSDGTVTNCAAENYDPLPCDYALGQVCH